MADDDPVQPKKPRAPRRKPDLPDLDELAGARKIAIVTFLAIDVFLFSADTLGRLFKDPAFHVDTVVIGFAIGATLTLLGLEGFQRLTGKDDDGAP